MTDDGWIDGWLESAYEDRTGDPHTAPEPEWELGDEAPCEACGAEPGEACAIDCPETPGSDEKEDT